MNPDQPLAMSEPASTHAPLGALHRGVMVLVPARAVDRPGAAGELVGEPVVGGGVEHLVAGQDRVELALHRGQVAGVAALGVDPEPDHQLRAVVVELLGVEVAERVTGPDRVLQHAAPRARG